MKTTVHVRVVEASTTLSINKGEKVILSLDLDTVNMNSPFGYLNNTPAKPLARNYSETFDPQEYEAKDSIELESYARNLHNYLNSLLTQEPFPAFLFEKLEKRLDGITCILAKRCAASGALNKAKAKARLETLGQRLEPVSVPVDLPPTTPRSMIDVKGHPPKKRKLDCVREVKEDMDALRSLKDSYSTQEVEEEED